MPGLHRRSPLKGLGRGDIIYPFRVALPVIPSLSEESPPRFPTVLIGKRARDASLRLSMTGEGLDDSANVRELSPFSGLRLGSPGIYPRAGWTERTANAWPYCSPGRGRGDAPFGIPPSRSPYEPPAATRSGFHTQLPWAGRGREAAKRHAITFPVRASGGDPFGISHPTPRAAVNWAPVIGSSPSLPGRRPDSDWVRVTRSIRPQCHRHARHLPTPSLRGTSG